MFLSNIYNLYYSTVFDYSYKTSESQTCQIVHALNYGISISVYNLKKKTLIIVKNNSNNSCHFNKTGGPLKR